MKRLILPICSFVLAAIIFGAAALLAQNPSVQFQTILNLITNLQNQINSIQNQINSLSLPLGGTSGQFVVENQTATGAIWASLGGDLKGSTITPGNVTVTGLQGIPLSTATPALNNLLGFPAGGQWAPVSTIQNFNVNGQINVKNYGASGSDNSYTCTMNSTSTTLTCTTSTDFVIGQYVAVPTAGPSSPITGSPTITAVTNLGTAGGVTDCYELVTADPAEGLIAANTPVCNATGPAAGAFTTASGLQVAFNNGTVAVSNRVYGIYRQIGGGAFTLVNVSTSTGVYKDFGQDIPKTYDFPLTAPTARNETLYGKVLSGSGTTWVLDTAASNTATSVSVRHDDTVAVQAAYDAGAGAQVYFPPGTYHINMVLLLNGSTRSGYAINGTSIGYNAVGSLLISGSGIDTAGAGQGVSVIKHDFAFINTTRGIIFGFAPPTWYGYTGPAAAADGTGTLTNYAINALNRGAQRVVTTVAASAGNFSPGDYVFISGGQAINGNYGISNITQVMSANSSTGVIKIRDAVTSDLPWGTATIPSYIENLTTNSVAQSDISIHDLTIDTPTTPIESNDVYNLHIYNVSMPSTPTSNSEIVYNEWSSKVTIEKSFLQADFMEFPLSANLKFLNNKIRAIQPGKASAMAIDGASSPFLFDGNHVDLGCGSGFALEGTILDATISNNVFNAVCFDGGSAQDTPTISWSTSIGNSLGNSWLFTNNDVFTTTNSSVMSPNLGTAATPPLFVISHNTLYWINPTTGSGISSGSSGQVLNNAINIKSDGLGAPVGVTLLPVTATTKAPPAAKNNIVEVTGTAEGTAVRVGDPGASYATDILVYNNQAVNMSATTSVASATDTPNVIFLGNDPVTAVCANAAATNPSTVPGTVACWRFTITSGSSSVFGPGASYVASGILTEDGNGSTFCRAFLLGTGTTPTLLDNVAAACTTTKDNAGTVNIYQDAGAGNYVIQNKTVSDRVFNVKWEPF